MRTRVKKRKRQLQIETLEVRHLLSADPIINEFLASNSGVIQDEDGDYSDFIEIYNRGDEAIDLAGWYLTDDDDDLTKWAFPSTNLAAGQYLVVFASSKDRALVGSQLHTNFAISVDGEYLALVQPDGFTIASEFSPEFPQQYQDVSYGVSTDSTGTTLLGPGSTSQIHVPSSGTLGTTWTEAGFAPDGSWQSGDLGVGYNSVSGPPPSTTVLAVDFNDRGNTGLTQLGFNSFVINAGPESQTASVTRNYSGGVSVTLHNASSEPYEDRVRDTPFNAGEFTESALLRDFIFSREQTAAGGLDVVIDGLDAFETYTLTVWSFDSVSTSLRTSDWTANGIVAAENYSFAGNALPTSNDTYRFAVVVNADAQGRITLQGRNDEITGNFGVFLNALRVETGDALNPPPDIDDVLRIDFNSRNSSEVGVADTEPGYFTMSLDENNATIGDAIVTVSPVGGVQLDDRDRTGPVDSGAFTLDQVYDDFIFVAGAAGDGLDVLVSGLVANTAYEVVLRSFDALAAGPRQSTWTEINSGTTIASGYVFEGSTSPTTNDDYTMRATVTSSPSGTLLFRGVQDGPERSVVLNGLELSRASFDELINFDVEASMFEQNSSIYIRTPFSINDPSLAERLFLDVQYDSGFVAYLNGQEVARRNTPTAVGVPPAFNAAANFERSVSETVAVETIDLTSFTNLLNIGGANVLSIHGLNSAAGDADFLIVPTLRGETIGGETLRYFQTPTPGAANQSGVIDFVAPVATSHSHGFYDAPFFLNLSTETFGADIYYTFDGSIPSSSNPAATLYTAPFQIDTTSVFRAAAFRENFANSVVTTQTYIFLEDVLTQDPQANPGDVSYPALWQANYPGDYAMDPRIVDQWNDNNPGNMDYGIREALLSLPTMSIVMDHDDLWDPSIGIYPRATSEGDFWRRAGSIEYFDPNTGEEFQYNVGVQMHGAASRDNTRTPKHSFRLIFNPEWDGPGRLEFPLFDNSDYDNINTVVMRATFTDSFATRTITNRYSPLDSTMTRDVWMRDSQLAMGSHAPDSTYVHLYINGLYWGLYSPAERTDDAFLADRIGGEREDWDIIRDFNELYRGDKNVWNEMFAIAEDLAGATSSEANAIYHELQGKNPDGSVNPALPVYLDMENLIDYMILHIYAGVEDWPSHNWVAARNRVDPGTGFQFFTWDQEIALDSFFRDRTEVNNDFTPARLYNRLRASSEFRLHFADRLEKHLFNDGALTVDASIERWLWRANQVEAAIIGESARWGDAREGQEIDYGPGYPTIVPLMTVDHWRDSIQNVVDGFTTNHALAISRFTADGLYNNIDAPQFSQFGGTVPIGYDLSMFSSSGGTIWYTTNGEDPRLLGGAVNVGSATAYGGSISIDQNTIVRARTRVGSQWSPLTEATFLIDVSTLDPTTGDYDGSGIVERGDHQKWMSQFSLNATPGTNSDGNGDGVINAADYVIWRNNAGAVGGPTVYPFQTIGGTYSQGFDPFRGSVETVPQYFSIEAGGDDVYRGVFDSTVNTASDFTGIMAATNNGVDYSLAWRESTGGANLEDARVLFSFTNNTGEPIYGFDVSYDVEAWVNGRRDNLVVMKYDVFNDSTIAQSAEGRNAFETNAFATLNPNHTSINSNGEQFVLDGNDPANRVTVSGFVDLTSLLRNENEPGLGVFGPLMPGQTGYFRWQISNGLLTDGNRSALAIDNLSVTAVGQMMGAASGSEAFASAESSTVASPLPTEEAFTASDVDLAFGLLSDSTSRFTKRFANRDSMQDSIAQISRRDDLLRLPITLPSRAAAFEVMESGWNRDNESDDLKNASVFEDSFDLAFAQLDE